jgi:hypothetical protein
MGGVLSLFHGEKYFASYERSLERIEVKIERANVRYVFCLRMLFLAQRAPIAHRSLVAQNAVTKQPGKLRAMMQARVALVERHRRQVQRWALVIFVVSASVSIAYVAHVRFCNAWLADGLAAHCFPIAPMPPADSMTS